jgi:large subunit ribosomal protein L25
MDVSHLEIDQGIHVRDLILPPDITVKADPDLLLVHVVMRAVVEEVKPEPEVAEAPVQPEVIKPERKEKEKEG